jgi:hypothetical protein
VELIAALVGGMLHAFGDVLNITHLGVPFAESIGSSIFFVQQMVYLLSAALLLLGLVGLYAIQSERTGRLGMVGFLLAFLGTVLFAGAIWALLFIGPLVTAEAPNSSKGNHPLPPPTDSLPEGSWCRMGCLRLAGCCLAWPRCVPASFPALLSSCSSSGRFLPSLQYLPHLARTSSSAWP